MNVIQNDAMIMWYRLSTSYFTPFCHESDNVFWQKNQYASFSNVFFFNSNYKSKGTCMDLIKYIENHLC